MKGAGRLRERLVTNSKSADFESSTRKLVTIIIVLNSVKIVVQKQKKYIGLSMELAATRKKLTAKNKGSLRYDIIIITL